MKNKRIMWSFATISVLVLGVIFSVYAQEPGSVDDPIVTKSYIDEVVSQVRSYVDEKISLIPTSGTGSSGGGVNDTYKVVKLADGQKISFNEGAEFILRMGKGTIFASTKGGIADITSGVDLQNGVSLPANHLMIVPLSDGRGFTAIGDVLVMVRGGYKIN